MKKNFKKVSLMLMLAVATSVSLNSCGEKAAEETHTEEAVNTEDTTNVESTEVNEETEAKCEAGKCEAGKCGGAESTEETTVVEEVEEAVEEVHNTVEEAVEEVETTIEMNKGSRNK